MVLGVRTRVELHEDSGESPLPESRPTSLTENLDLAVKNNEIKLTLCGIRGKN